MKGSQIKFGTGGFRGIIADTFTKRNVELIAAALTEIIKSEGAEKLPVIIGYDRRFLSDSAAQWLASVFAAGNIPVEVIKGESPTPLIMYHVKATKAAYGMAITASHNPAEYNGIKLFTAGGRDATPEYTNKVEAICEKLFDAEIETVPFEAAVKSGTVKIVYPHNDYIDSILSSLDIPSIKDARLRILLDPMYGVSKTSLQTVLLTCRCEVDVIHERHDTLFGGRLPSPSAKTLNVLSDIVVSKGYDLGIGTDGDADRIGLIDAHGAFIHPNDILVLLYCYLLRYKKWKGPVVRSTATTHLLDKIADKFGEECYEVPVGFKNISSKMNETDAIIGGESSGGLTVRGHISGKDGIYAAALLIEMVSVIKKPLSKILEDIHNEFGSSKMVEFDTKLSEELKADIIKKLFDSKILLRDGEAEKLFGKKVDKVSYSDGCKVYFADGGFIICRFSGTEPLIRIFAEAKDSKTAAASIEAMKRFLNIE